tara:strand:- start:77 stop:523 length:447 start_codon:yes stop_codon:yes gene_type:complete
MGTALIGSVERPQHVTPIDEPKRVGLVRGLKFAGKLAARAAAGLPGAVVQSFLGDMGNILDDKAELAGLRRRGKTREEVEQQGGPLSRKVDELLPQILEDHGIEWEYHENGGITADASFRDRSGRMIPDRKYFRPGTTLRTVRDWLGY